MSAPHAAGIDWHSMEFGSREGIPLLLLHGFTGSAAGWSSFAARLSQEFRMIALDLPGHGRTPLPESREIPLARLANSLAEWISEQAMGPSLVLGYSMGGRLALNLALQHPELIQGLILIGASAGIADSEDRRKRWEQDCALAKAIRERGIEWFADYWEALPIFKSQQVIAPELKAALRNQRLANSPEGLAFALEQWSPGKQECLLSCISELNMPLLLIAGKLDEKYCTANREIERAAIRAQVTLVEIPQAGHAAHVEKPEAVARILNDFLITFRNRP